MDDGQGRNNDVAPEQEAQGRTGQRPSRLMSRFRRLLAIHTSNRDPVTVSMLPVQSNQDLSDRASMPGRQELAPASAGPNPGGLLRRLRRLVNPLAPSRSAEVPRAAGRGLQFTAPATAILATSTSGNTGGREIRASRGISSPPPYSPAQPVLGGANNLDQNGHEWPPGDPPRYTDIIPNEAPNGEIGKIDGKTNGYESLENASSPISATYDSTDDPSRVVDGLRPNRNSMRSGITHRDASPTRSISSSSEASSEPTEEQDPRRDIKSRPPHSSHSR